MYNYVIKIGKLYKLYTKKKKKKTQDPQLGVNDPNWVGRVGQKKMFYCAKLLNAEHNVVNNIIIIAVNSADTRR